MNAETTTSTTSATSTDGWITNQSVRDVVINLLIVMSFFFIVAISGTNAMNTEFRCAINSGSFTMIGMMIGIVTIIVGASRLLFMCMNPGNIITCEIGLSIMAVGLVSGAFGLMLAIFALCFVFCVIQFITLVHNNNCLIAFISIGVICFILQDITPATGYNKQKTDQELYGNCKDAEWGFYLNKHKTTGDGRTENVFMTYTGLYQDAVNNLEIQRKFYENKWINSGEKVWVDFDIAEMSINKVPLEVAIQSGDIERARIATKQNTGRF